MGSGSLHKLWLKIAALAIGLGGPVLTLSTMPAYSGPARYALDLLTWPLDGFPSYQSQEMWFLSAVTGGVLVGWGVMMWCLSIWLYDLAPEAVRKTYVASILCWFVFDSLGSITSGYWPNAVWNVLFLIVLVGPMWRPAREAG